MQKEQEEPKKKQFVSQSIRNADFHYNYMAATFGDEKWRKNLQYNIQIQKVVQ